MNIEERAKYLLSGRICENCCFLGHVYENCFCRNEIVGNKYSMDMGWNNYSVKPIEWDDTCENFQSL